MKMGREIVNSAGLTMKTSLAFRRDIWYTVIIREGYVNRRTGERTAPLSSIGGIEMKKKLLALLLCAALLCTALASCAAQGDVHDHEDDDVHTDLPDDGCRWAACATGTTAFPSPR